MLDLDHELAAISAGDPDAFARWIAGAEPSLRGALRPLAPFQVKGRTDQRALHI